LNGCPAAGNNTGMLPYRADQVNGPLDGITKDWMVRVHAPPVATTESYPLEQLAAGSWGAPALSAGWSGAEEGPAPDSSSSSSSCSFAIS